MRRIRILIRGRVSVEKPRQPAVIANHDIWIRIEGEKRRKRADTIANVAAHQQQTLRADVVTEGKLGQVAAVKGDQETASKPSYRNAAIALIRGHAIGLALREIKFLLACLHVDVSIGKL